MDPRIVGAASGGQIPPWICPPRDCRPVEFSSELVLAPAQSTVTILQRDLPRSLAVVFNRIGFDSIDRTDLDAATWSIYVNGNLLASHSYLPCAIGYVDEPAECFINLERENEIRIDVTNTDAVLDSWFRARLSGWIYKPESGGD